MALTNTTLAGPFTATSLSFNATSAAGATVNGWARVDAEYMRVQAIDGNKVSVYSRGDHGGNVVNHDIAAPVTFGAAIDMAGLGTSELVPVPTDRENIVSIGQNTTLIPCPSRDTLFLLTKTSALSATAFAAPSKAQDGLQVTFINLTAFAHAITSLGINNGVTGGAKLLFTSPAFAGGALTLIAFGGVWYVRSNNLWVIA